MKFFSKNIIYLIRQTIFVICLLYCGTLLCQPVASFTAGPLEGCAPLTVRFVNTSSGNPTSLNWNLGDGTTSVQQNPTITYSTPGIYTISLKATNANGSNTLTKPQYIRVFDKPTVNFLSTDTLGCSIFSTGFTDASSSTSGSVIAWEWDFGDGTTAIQQNPIHQYTSSGYFDVTLRVANAGGCINALSKPQYIHVLPSLKAAFNFTKGLSCKPPDTISFTNLSTGSGSLNYSWDFGDGVTSAAINPSHLYTNGGIFSPTLIVQNEIGCADTLIKKDSVVIKNNLSIINGKDSVCIGTTATFINGSVPTPISSSWSFEDGTVSINASVTKKWDSAGIYTIKLVNNYGTCADSIIKNVRVLSLPIVKISANDSNSCKAPFTVSFADLTANAVNWQWNFGDGNTATLINPSNSYNTLDTFDITLIVTDAAGCTDTGKFNNFIKIIKPAAKIANVPIGGCFPFSFTPVAAPLTVDGIASYFWDLGNGTTSTSSSPTASYPLAGNYSIKLIITTNDGCIDSTEVLNGIMVSTKTAIDFSATPTSQCFNSPIQFADLTPLADRWLWNLGNGEFSSLKNFSYLYKDTGTYSIQLIAWSNGCSDTLTKTNYITINPAVARFKTVYNCTNRLQISFNDSSVLPQSWLWDFGDGTSSTAQNPTHTYTSFQNYTVTLTVTNGSCTDTKSALVYTGSSITDFISAKDSICKSEPVFFTATAAIPVRVVKYIWDFGDGVTQTSTQIGISHLYNNGGVYTIKLFSQDVNGCTDSIIKTNKITVFAPKANFTLSSATGCLPMTINFVDNSLNPYGSNNIASWQWNFDDGKTSIFTAPPPSPINHFYDTAGNFYPSLKIIDSLGCVDSIKYNTPLVVSKPVASFTEPEINTCRNQNIQLVNTSKTNIISSEWFFGDSTTSNQFNPVKGFTVNGNYNTKLVVTDFYGCKDSIEKINYFKIQDVNASFKINDSVGTCVPFKVSFNNTSQFATFQTWNFGDSILSSLVNPTHYFTEPGTYLVTLTAKRIGNCKSVATKKIEIFVPTASLLYQAKQGCAPVNVNFKVSTSAKVSYLYDFNDGNTIESADSSYTYDYTLPGSFIPKVILKDSSGCLAVLQGTDSIQIFSSKINFGINDTLFCGIANAIFTDSTISGSTVTNYNWSFGDETSSSLKNPTHTYTSTGKYTVGLIIQTAYGCIDTLVKNNFIQLATNPQIAISGNNIFCGPTNVLLQGSLISSDTFAIQWQWKFGNGNTSNLQNPPPQPYSVPNTYPVQLIATSGSGCADTAKTLVIIHPLPITFAGNDTTICLNNSIQLQATGADSYVWNPIALLSCDSCSNPIASLTDNTSLYVTGSTIFGCETTDTIFIKVKKPFVINGLQPSDTICGNNKLQLFVNGAENYIWSPANGLNNSKIANPIASPAVTTIYTVTGYDSNNCFRDSAFINLQVFKNPTVNAGEDKLTNIGKSVTISPQYSSDVIEWLWEPATYLNCSNCPSPVATPEFNTTYKLTVKNAGGCQASDNMSVKLTCDKNNLFIPTAFTPNNDGLNDFFYPISTGVFKILSLRIFNRKGELVFQNGSFKPNDKTKGWDGKYKGQIADEGSYVYSIEIICNNNNSLSFSGNILLLK